MEVDEGQLGLQDMGGSLPVSSVQHLASGISGNEIPGRYVRPEIMMDPISSDGLLEIPVVDLSKLLDQRFSQPEMDKLHLACREWGFFQLE
ncbi:hypothetical protein ACLOJK_030319 [Asimina triloba]